MLKAKKMLINQYKIERIGYDFMGYTLQPGDIYTFHHLIVQNKKGGKATTQNGAILCGKSSHPYIHLIEKVERPIFSRITNIMIEMKEKKELNLEDLRKIHELLSLFEDKHDQDENSIGEPIIKPEFKIRIFKNK